MNDNDKFRPRVESLAPRVVRPTRQAVLATPKVQPHQAFVVVRARTNNRAPAGVEGRLVDPVTGATFMVPVEFQDAHEDFAQHEPHSGKRGA